MRDRRTGRQALDVFASHGRSDWFRIVNRADDDETDVMLYQDIGLYGTDPVEFAASLGKITTGTINVHLNSKGGDVFDGVAIYNALRQHPARVVAYVDSMAASIASVIVQAGDERVMLTGSQMMIHEAWGLAVGDAASMRGYAEMLDKQSGVIASIYAENGSLTVEEYRALMADETLMDHDETVAAGLADRVLTPAKKKTEASKNRASGAPPIETDWAAFIADATSQEIFV